MSDHFKLIPAVHLFLMKDDQVLLSRRFHTGYEDGNYSVPAGHVDGNEPVTSAMIREAREEIGITLTPSDLKVVHVMHRVTNEERIDFFFTARHWEGEICNAEPEKCDDLHWFPLDQLPENTIPYIRSALSCLQSGQFYSEFGWEKKGER